MPRDTMTLDEALAYLDGVAEAIPEEILAELNGGIVMLPDVRRSDKADGLYTLGQYNYDPLGLGRYVNIFYGSFRLVYGHLPRAQQQEELKKVLYHELTHHLESLAGVRDLEVEDEVFLEQYKRDNPDKTKD